MAKFLLILTCCVLLQGCPPAEKQVGAKPNAQSVESNSVSSPTLKRTNSVNKSVKINAPDHKNKRQLVKIREEEGEPGCIVSAFQIGSLTEKTPPELVDELACTGSLSTLDRTGERFILETYVSGKSIDIWLYDFRDKSHTKLFGLFPDTDGLGSVVWSDDGRYAAFVNVNQERYKTGTTVFLMKFDANGKFVKKRNVAVPVQFMCGGSCYPETLRFNGTILSYRTHAETTDGKWAEIPLGL